MSAKKLAERLLAIVERWGDLPVHPDPMDDDTLHKGVEYAVMVHVTEDGDHPPGLKVGDPYITLVDREYLSHLHLAEDAIYLEWRGPKLPLRLHKGMVLPLRIQDHAWTLEDDVVLEQQADGQHSYKGDRSGIPAYWIDWSHPTLVEYGVLESHGGEYHQRASKAMSEAVALGNLEGMSLAGYWLHFVERKDPK